jgi:predicted phosphodiesterase
MMARLQSFILRGSDLISNGLGSAYRTSLPAAARALVVLAITYVSVRIGQWVGYMLPSQGAVGLMLLYLIFYVLPIFLILLLEQFATRLPDCRSPKRIIVFWVIFVVFGLLRDWDIFTHLPREGFKVALILSGSLSHIFLRGFEICLLRLPSKVRDNLDVLKTAAVVIFVVLWARISPVRAILVSGLFAFYGGAVLVTARARRDQFIRTESFPSIVAERSTPYIFVLSDTHLGKQDSEPTNKFLDSLLKNNDAGASSILLFSGDITNEGLQAEWQEFDRIIETYAKTRQVLLLPGNHDLLFGSDKLFRREARFLLRLWKCLPEDVFFDNGSEVKGVRQFLSPEIPNLLSTAFYGLKAKPTKWNGQQPGSAVPVGAGTTDLLEAVYPMWFDDVQQDVRIIMLNSCARPTLTWIDNAQGQLGHVQLERLRIILERTEQKNILIALHHQVGFPTEKPLVSQLSWMSRYMEWSAFSLHDKEEFLKTLGARPGIVIVHGHKHVAYSARIGDKWILSSPSATKSLEARMVEFPSLFGLRFSQAAPVIVDLSNLRKNS